MVLMYALYEHASGYALFLVKEFEEVSAAANIRKSYFLMPTMNRIKHATSLWPLSTVNVAESCWISTVDRYQYALIHLLSGWNDDSASD